MQRVTELHVNDTSLKLDAESDRSLLSVLRDDLDLTGTKYGCGEGQCGACTVLIGGTPTRSCITAAGLVGGKPITTIEGIGTNGKLHPLQQAFLEADALQCGYCTSGMIMSGVALLARNGRAGAEEIIDSMEGNIGRCGTYPRIVDAIAKAAAKMNGGAK